MTCMTQPNGLNIIFFDKDMNIGQLPIKNYHTWFRARSEKVNFINYTVDKRER